MSTQSLEPARVATRPAMGQTLMAVAALWADRSTCARGAVGCVLADYRGVILSSGYNGAPEGAPHCLEIGCLMEDGHCVRAVHAEVNAIASAARRGVRLEGAKAWLTVRPCLRCAYLLISAGVSAIHYYYDAGSEDSTMEELRQVTHGAKVRLLHHQKPDPYGLLEYRQSPKAAG